MSKKVVFMGSGRFAVEVLKELVDKDNIEIITVVTQKDKPVGRKKILTSTNIGEFCADKNRSCQKLESSAEILDYFKTSKIEIDFLIVADYGVILNQELLDYAKVKSLNVHGSILPCYRGASPVHSALLNCDIETGVTIIEMVKELDAGPVYAVSQLEIEPEHDYPILLQELGKLGGKLIIKVVNNFESITAIEQNELKASYSPKITKEDGLIDFSNIEYEKLLGMSKAYIEWPGVYFVCNGKKFVLEEFELVEGGREFKVGEFVEEGNFLFVRLSDFLVKIVRLKPESKNSMLASDFLRGNTGFFIAKN
jgi:methionyl-tRNA formyltransferase